MLSGGPILRVISHLLPPGFGWRVRSLSTVDIAIIRGARSGAGGAPTAVQLVEHEVAQQRR